MHRCDNNDERRRHERAGVVISSLKPEAALPRRQARKEEIEHELVELLGFFVKRRVRRVAHEVKVGVGESLVDPLDAGAVVIVLAADDPRGRANFAKVRSNIAWFIREIRPHSHDPRRGRILIYDVPVAPHLIGAFGPEPFAENRCNEKSLEETAAPHLLG